MTEGITHLIETYEAAHVTRHSTLGDLLRYARTNGAVAIAYRGGKSANGPDTVTILHAIYRYDRTSGMDRVQVTRVGYVNPDGTAVLAPGHAVKFWQRSEIFDSIVNL